MDEKLKQRINKCISDLEKDGGKYIDDFLGQASGYFFEDEYEELRRLLTCINHLQRKVQQERYRAKYGNKQG